MIHSEMIICITPNPAIDRTVILPSLVVGNVHRAQKNIVVAGGKGLNVARAIRTLGGQALCMGLAGGHTGHWLAELAQKEGLHSYWTWTDAETRICTIIVPQNMDATVINEPGTPIAASDWKRLQQDVQEQMLSASTVCISGSLPPNSSADDFQELLSLLVDAGKQVWVDTSGIALQIALAHPGVCIKVNGTEIGEALGFDVNDAISAQRALMRLGERGSNAAVITLGVAGAFLATKEGRWHVQGPLVQIVSTVGSGDAFLGGLVNALDRDSVWPEALCDAVAAGTANALSAGAGQFALQEFQSIREQVRIQNW